MSLFPENSLIVGNGAWGMEAGVAGEAGVAELLIIDSCPMPNALHLFSLPISPIL
jgi:hypothetical protein